MKVNVITRAWKDKKFRRGLSSAERALIPDNPAGISFLSDKELELIAGSFCSCSPSAICCFDDSWSEPSACMSDCSDCAPDSLFVCEI